MNRRISLLLALSIIPLHSAVAVETAMSTKVMVACVRKSSGAVTVKARCNSAERKLSLATLQVSSQPGPQGFRGEQGISGLNGVNGLNGEKGEKGDRGDIGPAGATGPIGPMGPQGVAGVQGPIGSTGSTGPQGPAGPQGVRGVSAFNTIPSGTTVYGAVGGDFHSATANGEWGVTAAMLGIPPVSFSNNLVVVKNNLNVDNECGGASCLHSEELTYSQYCNGSVDAPSANPGWICIYPTQDTNASQVRAIALPNGDGSHGFTVKWVSAATGRTIFRGVWAYTAP